ncbi:HNH endonuclease [Terrihalobacillus insolitus]|uniref:HNH endonuclease n=1 Tax=Terrihalobacillus insolitus TaxID=2950438 RepID=UPI0023408653|nr:HNH endonuclease [Terrihalobacillus insolitus]MDC3413897.1 HNH endonuclease [Terrihalobacillus insolitus]
MNAERLEHLKKHIHLLDIDVENGLILNRKPYLRPKGYYLVGLKNKIFRVHEIIAVSGGLNILNKTVNHIDGNRLNNRISNLEAVSKEENFRHAFENDLLAKGSKIGISKLTEKQVIEIKRLLNETNLSTAKIGKMFNVSGNTISAIKHNRTWSHVGNKIINKETNYKKKLTETEVKKIKQLLSENTITQSEIAKMFGVTVPNISSIKNGKSWTHVN